MSNNECISCIKDGVTGICRDIKDKVAREEIENVKKEVAAITGVDGEHLVTDEDLKNYVKKTDYAGSSNAGVVMVADTLGISCGYASNGRLNIMKASDTEIDGKENLYKPIVPATLDHAVKVGVTTNTNELTAEEKASAQSWLGVPSNSVTTELQGQVSTNTGNINTLVDSVNNIIDNVNTLDSDVERKANRIDNVSNAGNWETTQYPSMNALYGVATGNDTFINSNFENVDAFLDWVKNSAPVGAYTKNIVANGMYFAMVIQKTSSQYASVLQLSYVVDYPVLRILFAGEWAEHQLKVGE